jgi:predicted nucleic-acid-binding protein
MRAFDTNVVVRLLVEDDLAQTRAAETAWRDAVGSGGAFVSALVLVEVTWVLARSYAYDRESIATVVRGLLDAAAVTIEQRSRVERALGNFASSGADLSDYLVLEGARDADALPLITFDRKLGRESNVTLLSE